MSPAECIYTFRIGSCGPFPAQPSPMSAGTEIGAQAAACAARAPLLEASLPGLDGAIEECCINQHQIGGWLSSGMKEELGCSAGEVEPPL